MGSSYVNETPTFSSAPPGTTCKPSDLLSAELERREAGGGGRRKGLRNRRRSTRFFFFNGTERHGLFGHVPRCCLPFLVVDAPVGNSDSEKDPESVVDRKAPPDVSLFFYFFLIPTLFQRDTSVGGPARWTDGLAREDMAPVHRSNLSSVSKISHFGCALKF